MPHADAAALQRLLPLLRQLRDITGIREVKPGIFYLRGSAFLHFHETDGVLHADLKKPGGPGFDRFRVDAAPAQRQLVADAKRRAGRDDE